MGTSRSFDTVDGPRSHRWGRAGATFRVGRPGLLRSIPMALFVLATGTGCVGETSAAPLLPFDRRDHISAPNVDFIRLADVDGDGDLDILAVEPNTNRLDWYENETGRGDAFRVHSISRSSGGVRIVAPGDVDNDGDIDFYALEPNRTRIRLYINDGAGGFEVDTRFAETAVGVTYIEAADVDGDGHADLFVVFGDDDRVELWWNPGFPESRERMVRDRIANARAWGVERLRVGDIDGDGLLDFTTAQRSPNNNIMWWRQSLVDGKREWTPALTAPLKEIEVISAPIADIDNDGDVDILALRRVPYVVFQWLQQPDGRFVRDPEQLSRSPGGDNRFNWNSIDVGDMDGDGDIDFATSELDGTLCWYANPLISSAPTPTSTTGIPPTADVPPTSDVPTATTPSPTATTGTAITPTTSPSTTATPTESPTTPGPGETPDPPTATPNGYPTTPTSTTAPVDQIYLPWVMKP